MARIRSRLTFANVVSVLALFVALSGSATAAVLITGKNVKDGTLTGKDIKNNSVRSVDIKDGDLLAKDFKAGQRPAGPQGLQGPKGDQGAKGDQGPKGDPGPSNLYTAYVDTKTHNAPWSGHWDWDDLATVTPTNGNYLVFANAIVTNDTPGEIGLFCMLGPGGAWEGSASMLDSTYVTLASGETSALHLTGPGDLPDYVPGTKLLCRVDTQPLPASGSVTYEDIDLGALKVGDWQPQ